VTNNASMSLMLQKSASSPRIRPNPPAVPGSPRHGDASTGRTRPPQWSRPTRCLGRAGALQSHHLRDRLTQTLAAVVLSKLLPRSSHRCAAAFLGREQFGQVSPSTPPDSRIFGHRHTPKQSAIVMAVISGTAGKSADQASRDRCAGLDGPEIRHGGCSTSRRPSVGARQTSSAQRTYRIFGVKPAFSKIPNAPEGFTESTLKLARS
jgi:hypothetical protein